jgi:glyoxylase-like metal-dependent hydrolase (beta-lactamase superfamily II)
MKFGNTELYVVSDGVAKSDGGSVYGLVPKVLWEKITPPDENNKIPSPLNCLLVVSQGKKILIDTGLGDKLDAKSESHHGRIGGSILVAELNKLGFAPSDIDIVINTHLHSDHCGGNTRCVDGQIVPTFPNAQYLVQRLEWADASFPNERTQGTYFSDNFKPIENRVRLLNGETHVTDDVKCIITRGHTRSHQSVVIESDGKKAMFIGDIASRTTDLERIAWIAAVDVEPLESLETKRWMRDWAIAENVLLIFQHEYRLTMGSIRKNGDKFFVEKVG